MYHLDWAFVSTNPYETDTLASAKGTNLHDSASKRPHDATSYHQ